jgi:hypothetical protein
MNCELIRLFVNSVIWKSVESVNRSFGYLLIRSICSICGKKTSNFQPITPFDFMTYFFNRKERKVLRKVRKDKSLIALR